MVRLTSGASEDVLARHLPQEFTSLTGHTEAVEDLAASDSSEVTILADGPTCPVQLIRVGNSTWASQFHAEMDAVAMKKRMDFSMTTAISPRRLPGYRQQLAIN